jgi:hypothetical protein
MNLKLKERTTSIVYWNANKTFIIMNKLKIFITLAILSLLVVGVYESFNDHNDKVVSPNLEEDSKDLQKSIESIKNQPTSVLNNRIYHNALNYIEIYYGDDEPVARDRAFQDLYAAYAPKFVDQAFYYLWSTEWNANKIDLIEKEARELRSSKYLQRGSDKFKKLTQIIQIVELSRQISSFLISCKNYTPPPDDEIKTTYPLKDLEFLAQSELYKSNSNYKLYVSKKPGISSEMSDLGRMLFDKRINYMAEKLNHHSTCYCEYELNQQKIWLVDKKQVLELQIDAISQDDYGVEPGYAFERKSALRAKFTTISTNATDYFNQNRTKEQLCPQ